MSREVLQHKQLLMKIASTNRKTFCISRFLYIRKALVYKWTRPVRPRDAMRSRCSSTTSLSFSKSALRRRLRPQVSSTWHGAAALRKASLLLGFVRKERAFYVAVAEVRDGNGYRQDSKGVAGEGGPHR